MVKVYCPTCGKAYSPDSYYCKNPECASNAGRSATAPPPVQLFTFNPYGTGLETGAYKNLGLVSAYMALGTGPISMLLSSWTDFFGEESKVYNEKMTSATNACIARIKNLAHEMGADAVIGVQTTFTELTAGHGQIMVCMIGTAVKKTGEAEPGG